MKVQFILSAAIALLASGLVDGAVAAEGDRIKFEVAAELGNTDWYTKFEKPYFEEILPKVSGGALTANAVPYDQLGLTGYELIRLVKSRKVDIASVSMNFVTQDSPALNGGSLAGIAPDLDAFEKIYAAYRPVVEKELASKYNAKPLALFAWPQSQIFCNLPGQKNVTLASIKGKKIRSFAATASDLIEGLGAVPVTIPFPEVIPAIQRGTVECTTTSTLGAYDQKIYEVLTHKISVNLGYSASFIVINLDVWNGLSPQNKEILSTSMADLEKRMRADTQRLETEALACLTNGPCPKGKSGGLIEVTPTAEDLAKVRSVVESHVLKRYAERCGSQACIDDWNSTVGATMGFKASK